MRVDRILGAVAGEERLAGVGIVGDVGGRVGGREIEPAGVGLILPIELGVETSPVRAIE